MSTEVGDGRSRVGQAIRRERQSQGLSLSDLASRINVAVSTVSKIETGKISVSFERLDAIARALNIDLSKLIGGASDALDVVAEIVPVSQAGMRRSITRRADGVVVDSGPYRHTFHATDLLRKQFQTLVSDVLVNNIDEYGPLTHHPGEELNFILEGELEFHSEVYAPIRLAAGDSIHFDAEMGHAHIRVGSGRCRLLSIVSPRPAATETLKAGEIHQLRRNDEAQSTPVLRRFKRIAS